MVRMPRTQQATEKAERRTRPADRLRVRPGADELIARLERLESLVTAIAEHLGVRPGRFPSWRGAARREGAEPRQGRSEGAHAVVRTVARGRSGRVKMFNPSRGYGFIVSPDAPGDVFFHRGDCRMDPDALQPGVAVAFDLVEMASGQLKAVRLGPPPQGDRAAARAAPPSEARPAGDRPASHPSAP